MQNPKPLHKTRNAKIQLKCLCNNAVYTYKSDGKLLVALRGDDPRMQPSPGSQTPDNIAEQLFGTIDLEYPLKFIKLETLNESQLAHFALEYHLFIQDEHEWRHFQKYHPVVPIQKEGFQCIRIMEIRASEPESPLSSETVALLNMTKPTFRFVRGGTTVKASILETQVTLASASPRDTQGLIYQNRWFSNDTAAEIIIGNDVLKLLHGSAADPRNRNISITVSRKDRYRREESIQLPLRVIDFATHGMIPSGLATNLVQWQQGTVEFKNGKFVTPYEIDTALGSRRAKIFVENPKDIEAIQKEFAPLGYVIHHKLDMVENVRSLTRNMWVFVLVFNGSSFCLCLITLAGFACLVHSIKRNEFATMLQMGIPRACLIKGVFVEGIVYSSAALALAVVLILLLSSPYALVMENVFHIPRGVLDIRFQAVGNTAYLPIAAVFVIGCLGLGTQIPAMWIAWYDKRPQKI